MCKIYSGVQSDDVGEGEVGGFWFTTAAVLVYRSRGSNVEAKVMNFIISDLGSADSEIIQSVNLKHAAREGTRCFA